jgi:hypothetical protein
MPHDRLRFAWIPPPRGAWLPRRNARQERQPKKKGTGTNASPLCVTSDKGRECASEPHANYPDTLSEARAGDMSDATHTTAPPRLAYLLAQSSKS